MKEYVIRENEAGQRLDKYLGKLLNKAPKSFLYKMLRKKNITLNRKKAAGSEILSPEDLVILFMSDETIGKFSVHDEGGGPARRYDTGKTSGRETSGRPFQTAAVPSILYEDADVLFFNKPSGLLSQGDKSGDPSLVGYLTDYLLSSGFLTKEDMTTFHPGICNRLDRNTSGIVTAGKSLKGLQDLSELFRERMVRKFYLCLCHGIFPETVTLEGYLKKDAAINKVDIFSEPQPGTEYIRTRYRPLEVFPSSSLSSGASYTLVEAELFTGRSHQIRAQLASAGYPIAGDGKYAGKKAMSCFREDFAGIFQNGADQKQLLHGYKLEFPVDCKRLFSLSEKSFTAPLPGYFRSILKELHFEESRIYERQT